MKAQRPAIRNAFEHAANSYDDAATAQREAGKALLSLLRDALEKPPRDVLDAACGTGSGALHLSASWPQARLTLLDFSPAMLARALQRDPSRRSRYLAADIEVLPFPPASFDLYWSNLALQWCDASRTLAEAKRILRPGGTLAFSTLGPATFAELTRAFSGIDRYRHTLSFLAPETIEEALASAGFRNIIHLRQRIVCHYPELKQLLRAIKSIGANTLGPERRPGMMGKNAWRSLEAAYEKERAAEGLPLSYDVLLYCAGVPVLETGSAIRQI
ncbi:MAG: malonyl-ACP O-methyltransferase BioC [Betaproteobacteria bacterium]|nr:malonyl-ACP O-methyltransferase BioC [Betaproteobacteria bacterium]